MRALRRQGDKISAVLKAAGVSVEPYWPGLFAKTLAAQKLDDLITNIGSGACLPPEHVATARRERRGAAAGAPARLKVVKP